MKKKKSQAEIDLIQNPINVFACGHSDCENLSAMNLADFKAHVLSVHKIDITGIKAKRQMTAHIDGDYWFSYDYNWELDTGLKFHQHIMMARTDDDLMRY